MTQQESAPDALMDPWCVVTMLTGREVLFGFCHRHPFTGGLSWTRSTEIQSLDEGAGRATTASGRLYELGRRVELQDIPALGIEAWVAYDLLCGYDAADEEAVPRVSADAGYDGRWVTACKMARHLKVAEPRRVPVEVDAFMLRHTEAYLKLHAGLGAP